MLEEILRLGRLIIPKPLFRLAQPFYHGLLAIVGAIIYRFPGRKIKVIAITGTKGKSSTVEFVNAILEAAGHKTALASTIRFKIGDLSRPNLMKMTMGGRFTLQRFLRRAVSSQCDYAVLEMTSVGTVQFRHWFIPLNALIFTGIQPEHLDFHGSYDKYLQAKLELAKAIARSPKRPRIVVANTDSPEAEKFLAAQVEKSLPYSLHSGHPIKIGDDGIEFVFKDTRVASPLHGEFNIANMLAAATLADALGIAPGTIKHGLESVAKVPGRAEMITASRADLAAKQDFKVVVDYAHTPESLTAIYEAFPGSRKVCVLGGTGGGRDRWKRKVMGEIADKYCAQIIITDEDPYDEDPKQIMDDVASGVENKEKLGIIPDRREAIKSALNKAETGDIVIVSGKGTDPYIMGPRGTKIPWSDARICQEELEKILDHA